MISLSERRPACETAQAASSPWIFSGILRDSVSFDQRCSMCGRQDLRLTFEVRMVTSGASCEFCENCLGNQAIPIEPGGPVLKRKELRYHLSELATRIMQRTCRDVLRDVLAGTSDGDMPEVAVYFDRNAQLSPRHAATLFMALSSGRPEVDLRIFEVQIRSVKHRQEFGSLGEPQKLAVWPVLSSTVHKQLIALGLAPKPHAQPQGKRSKPCRGQLIWTAGQSNSMPAQQGDYPADLGSH